MVISPEVIETFLQYRDFFSLKAEQLYEFLVKYSYPNLRGEIFQDVYCTNTHYIFCYGNDWDYEFSQEIEIPLDIINNSDLNDDECPLLAQYCTSLNDKIRQDKELAKTERKLKQYQKLKEELKL